MFDLFWNFFLSDIIIAIDDKTNNNNKIDNNSEVNNDNKVNNNDFVKNIFDVDVDKFRQRLTLVNNSNQRTIFVLYFSIKS